MFNKLSKIAGIIKNAVNEIKQEVKETDNKEKPKNTDDNFGFDDISDAEFFGDDDYISDAEFFGDEADEPTTKPKKRYLSKAEKIKKGKEYEFFLKNYFQAKEYKVFPNGYVKGVKDGGIDLIAYKDKEMILIQCKNWKNAPKQKDLKVFALDCENYIKDNQAKIKNKGIKAIFATSCKEKDKGVDYFINEYNAKNDLKLEYQIIELN